MKKLFIPLIFLFLMISCEKKETLYLFNWAEYIPTHIFDQFEQENNVKLKFDWYDSNEAMFVKIRSGASGYDIIFPSGDYVSIMRKSNMLQPIDKTKVPNLDLLDRRILDRITFDKNQEYSVPYMISVTGIAVNKNKVKDYPKSFEIYNRKDLAGKMILMDNMREVLDAALINLGFHANSTNKDEITAAGELVKKWKENILRFDQESFARSFAQGEIFVVHGYAENIFLELDERQKTTTDFFIPKGGTLSIDNMVILKNAKNPELAHKLINFILRPDVYAQVCDYLMLPSMNLESRSLMRLTPIYSIEDILSCEIKDDVGEAIELYNSVWQDIRIGG